MMWAPNIYSQPEKLGLTIFGELERSDLSYEFDMVVIWQDTAGNLYFAHDSGCSCPSPFEDYKGVDELTALPDEWGEAWDELMEAFDRTKPYDYKTVGQDRAIASWQTERTELEAKIIKHLRRTT